MKNEYEKKSKAKFVKMLNTCIAEEQSIIDWRMKSLQKALQDPHGKHEEVMTICSNMKNNYMTIRGLEFAKQSLDNK